MIEAGGPIENKDDQGSAAPANTDDEDYTDASGSGYQDEEE